jgi:dihydrofolate reductase
MLPSPRIALIAALANNRVIGFQNRLPWHLPADLKHFKVLTLDKPILMGRKTWESLPGPLPRRTPIVVSANTTYRANACILVPSVEEGIRAARGAQELMVVGGATLYRQLLPRAVRMYLTLVQADVQGDAWFPEWEPDDWRETAREGHPADERNAFACSFVTLERVSGG